jgi:hypothetical protein
MKTIGGLFLLGSLTLLIVESRVGSSQNFLFWQIALAALGILFFTLPPVKIERIKD